MRVAPGVTPRPLEPWLLYWLAVLNAEHVRLCNENMLLAAIEAEEDNGISASACIALDELERKGLDLVVLEEWRRDYVGALSFELLSLARVGVFGAVDTLLDIVGAERPAGSVVHWLRVSLIPAWRTPAARKVGRDDV